ncbi:SDR family NAD(P)-dependent oxidoreductase [Burkholderia cepacia]|nr:SDR family NAD(P)-dependent oxidoreductase [Burkholderia cepacia]MCA7935532.1 SDR family NAD(P)-dependent oxidoreductase [Burkholderia cepacia]
MKTTIALRTLARIALLPASFWFAGAVYAASFNCHLARQPAEQTICAVPELSKLDDQLAIAWSLAPQRVQVDRMFDEIERRYGRLDVLVNNAASGALDTNLKGAFWCARRAAALIISKKLLQHKLPIIHVMSISKTEQTCCRVVAAGRAATRGTNHGRRACRRYNLGSRLPVMHSCRPPRV